MRRRDRRNRIMAALGAVLLLLAIFLIAYFAMIVPDEEAFGERYVKTQVPLIFPFYVLVSFKPITLITYLVFSGVVLVLEARKSYLRRFDTRGVKLGLVFGAFASGYELIWNFYAWFALWQEKGGLLDLLANTTHEYYQLPWNFNFATKISFLVFAICVYGSLLLERLESEAGPTRG